MCTFNCPTVSSSDGLVQPIIKETQASIRFTFVCQREVETLSAPEKCVTRPHDRLVTQTPFDLTCQLTYIVNVKWWGKICTFCDLLIIPYSIFSRRCCTWTHPKEKRGKKKNSILQLLFTRPRLELHIKDCASHQSQATVGVGGGVHGYKIIVRYAGLASEV